MPYAEGQTLLLVEEEVMSEQDEVYSPAENDVLNSLLFAAEDARRRMLEDE